MALMEKDKANGSEPDTKSKRNPKAELAAEIAEKGFAIREITSGFIEENKALLSRPDLLQVTMLFNRSTKLSVPELLGFGGPVLILFKRDRRNAAGIGLEELFKAMPDNPAYKKSTLGRWMHENMFYTAIELEALTRGYGEKNYYTKEEYKNSYSTVKNMTNLRSARIQKNTLLIPHFTGVDRWAKLLRTSVEEGVSEKGFAIMPCVGVPNDADRESLAKTGILLVKSTLGVGRGVRESSTAYALGLRGPTAIFFKEETRGALCKELEGRFLRAFPERTSKDGTFYYWLYQSNISRGILTYRGKPIPKAQQY
ncbi:MAG TPA: hypothetical protein VMV00_02560 [Candidatus Baltobacteraceae bacterium]|nr:hypothetical protein [Candidatus Baltobacteraceae bacterium]